MSVLSERKKRRAALTTRQKMIIQMLVRMASEPVTVSAISEKLKVSSRTVLREMPVIERWFQDNDFHFVRKPGVGLMIDEDKEQLNLIRELLEIEDVIPSFSRQERRQYLLSDLLAATEPVKAYVFISRYHISEGTLYGDLDALNHWLKDYRISVLRKPGVGICLEGSETAYRQAIANTAFECLDENQLLGLLTGDQTVHSDTEIRGINQIIEFIDKKAVSFVEQMLAESEKKLGVKYTDSGYMDLIVHLSLAIRRMKDGKNVEVTEEEYQSLKACPEFAVAKDIAHEIEQTFRLRVSEAEVCYITMHLSSARRWPRATGTEGQVQTLNIRQIVMSMAGVVEQLTGLPFRSCSDMINDLVTHMNTMLSRLSMNLRIENSQTASIQQNYPEIYSAVEAACEMLQELLPLEEVPKSEVGFVAMHFAAAAEKIQESERQIAVVVVCPTGMGTSKMLAANLQRSFHNLEIRKIISAFGIDQRQLREEGIDLILSTVALNTEFPHLCVSPILQAQDKLLLQNAIELINKQRLRRKTGYRQPPAPDLEEILRVSRIGIEISEIIKNFQISQIESVSTHAELIERAAAVFANSEEDRQIIAEALEKRESLADTFLPEMGVYLLHCRTKAMRHSRFGYLRLKDSWKAGRGTVLGAVIMLGPESESTLHAEVLSGLSVLLVENNEFLYALQRGDKRTSVSLAEKALIQYYQNETTKRIGVDWG